ncbi:MAG: metalloprotease PmbA [Ectothiorhodospiraceae bacterium]|nr:metalloprotease PmbA [Chromatiales bacterium]MCP5154571.1 metalloprotease PmbA [Ectothiorhodospiraceae bacterium]
MEKPLASLTPEQRVARLGEIVESALAEARRLGATAADAVASTSTGLEVTVRLGEVETIEHTRDRGLGVTVYFGQRKGSASTSDLGPSAVAETVAAACSIARHTAEDPCAGLADAARMAREVPELELYHPWPIDAEAAVAIALRAENAARGADARIVNSEGATVSRHEGEHVYGNSHGFLGGYPSSRHGVSCSVIARDDAGMQRDYWWTAARDARRLEDAELVGTRAAERAVRRLSARKVSTRTVPVAFTPEVAGGLIRHLVGAVSGGNLYRKSSFLVDGAGRQVFPDWVRIHEQPHLPGALGSAPFDNEGVATAARDLVRDGVLQGYVLGSYSARKLGLETTGNAGGVHNLTVEPGPDGKDLEAILAEMGSGLLVTEMMGMGVNLTTGDYSRGASGFWVEGGAVAYPVEEITIAGSLPEMYRGVRQLGTDVDTRGNIRCGSVLIDQMTVAGD